MQSIIDEDFAPGAELAQAESVNFRVIGLDYLFD